MLLQLTDPWNIHNGGGLQIWRTLEWEMRTLDGMKAFLEPHYTYNLWVMKQETPKCKLQSMPIPWKTSNEPKRMDICICIYVKCMIYCIFICFIFYLHISCIHVYNAYIVQYGCMHTDTIVFIHLKDFPSRELANACYPKGSLHVCVFKEDGTPSLTPDSLQVPLSWTSKGNGLGGFWFMDHI